jgi:hypothetical protein
MYLQFCTARGAALFATIAISAMTVRAAAIRLDATASADASAVSQDAGYNSPFTFGGTGATSHQIFPPSCSCTFDLQHTGLTDTSGTDVSGSEGSTASINLAFGSASSSAFAAASLSGAFVRIQGGGTYLDSSPTPNSGQDGGTGFAWAQYNDVLHFTVAGANSTTKTDIGISYQLDGGFTVNTAAGDSNGSVNSTFQFGTASLLDGIASGPNAYTPAVTSTQENGWKSFTFLSNTPDLIQFDAVYEFTGPTDAIGITTTVTAHCGLGTNCDYSKTSQFGFTLLPGNVTYTSDSGVFDTSPPSVPEPRTMGCAAIALAALWWGRRRRAKIG